MAYNPLECLENGDIDFIFSQTPYDKESLIKNVRNAPNKNDIIKGFLPKLLKADPVFCFAIIYDNDAFSSISLDFLNQGYGLNLEMVINILKNTTWGKNYIFANIEHLESTIDNDSFPILFAIILENYQEYGEYIYYYKTHPNTHIRFLFMKYLLENYEDLFDTIYPNMMDYLTSVSYRKYEQLTLLPTLMSSEDICSLALLIFSSKYRDKYFNILKEYILANYKENDLAKVLMSPIKVPLSETSYSLKTNYEGINEFSKDADRLFLSSATEKFNIITNYPRLISKEILEQFLSYYKNFREEDDGVIALLNFHRLGQTLLEFIDKYLSLSKSKQWRYINSGTTGTVYQMGDYVLKMFRAKWSYEDVICPDLYLIVKNYEEVYIRGNGGIISCGLEVQPYLSRSAEGISEKTLSEFKLEFERLGYRSTDTFLNGPCGDNCRLLDSYKDADCKDPEKLPDWFKETPLVLVDRDRIYPKNKVHIRQLSSEY